MSSRAEYRGQHLVRADRRFATGGGRVLGLLAPAFKHMLDRVDSALLVAPAVYYFLRLVS